jgi:hypothetical protein
MTRPVLHLPEPGPQLARSPGDAVAFDTVADALAAIAEDPLDAGAGHISAAGSGGVSKIG